MKTNKPDFEIFFKEVTKLNAMVLNLTGINIPASIDDIFFDTDSIGISVSIYPGVEIMAFKNTVKLSTAKDGVIKVWDVNQEKHRKFIKNYLANNVYFERKGLSKPSLKSE